MMWAALVWISVTWTIQDTVGAAGYLEPPLTRVCLEFQSPWNSHQTWRHDLASLEVLVIAAVCPRLFESLTTLTFVSQWRNRIVSTAIEIIAKKQCKHLDKESSLSTCDQQFIMDCSSLRMDGIPALIAPSNIKQPKEKLRGDQLQATEPNMHKPIQFKHTNVIPTSPNALLYVFEDNEAVIKMIIKSRSPTMRHVSRTHRVALNWLFGKIYLDPTIQTRYIDTTHQLADIFDQKEISHVMSGIIFFICSILSISALFVAPKVSAW